MTDTPNNGAYFILGCTACGKGSVGRALARRLEGEVLSVDSMKIYRRMDIGTAKPSADARAGVSHWGLDLVEPSESYSVAQYAAYATDAIARIRSAGHVPLAVGGTSLYIQAMTAGLFDGPPADEALRAELTARAEAEGNAALHVELTQVDPAAAERIHANDRRRIIRALEVFRSTGKPISEHQTQWEAGQTDHPHVLLGLRRELPDQNHRINLRVKKMVEMGLRDEVEQLLAEPSGIGPQAAQAVGYAELIEHFRGKVSLDKAIENVKINTRRLAKKQRTWMRRWPGVQWFDLAEDEPIDQTVERILKAVSFC